MRYADKPVVECEIHIDAAPQDVWELVSDINLPARNSPELQRVEWLDGVGAPALGARFTGHNRHPMAGEWRTVSEIVELDDERAFAWAVMDADGRYGSAVTNAERAFAVWRFDLEPDGDGTRLRHSGRIGLGPSGLSVMIDKMPDHEEELMNGRIDQLRAGIEATLKGVKELAEKNR